MELYHVIKEPLVTEKVTGHGDAGKYSFRVDLAASKIDVRRAVEELFSVKVDDVKTLVMPGKPKRNPRSKRPKHSSDWKKAIVTLKKGGKIELFKAK